MEIITTIHLSAILIPIYNLIVFILIQEKVKEEEEKIYEFKDTEIKSCKWIYIAILFLIPLVLLTEKESIMLIIKILAILINSIFLYHYLEFQSEKLRKYEIKRRKDFYYWWIKENAKGSFNCKNLGSDMLRITNKDTNMFFHLVILRKRPKIFFEKAIIERNNLKNEFFKEINNTKRKKKKKNKIKEIWKKIIT